MLRRDVLKGLGAAAALCLGGQGASAAAAASQLIPYGAAVQDGPLREEADYRAALIEHCQLLVGEGGLKWFDVRPTPDQFVFDQPDRLIAFAAENGMRMRGHTLDWYAAMPDWALAIRGEHDAERELTRHIETVVGRYRGRVPSWDVVNEPIAENPGAAAPMRDSVWQAALGDRHVDLALLTASRVDPSAQLVINEYDIEMHDRAHRRKREALLNLVKDLKDRDIPLHAVGFQGHLRGGMEIDKEGVAAFVAELAGMDVDVLVTEMDVIDKQLPGPDHERDEAVAALANDFLTAIGDGGRPTAIVTWGISDAHTWVPIWFSRDDGRPNRPLPLDAGYRPKALMRVIDGFRRQT